MDSPDFFASSPVLVGHRGDPERHPDNSLAGIRAALATVGRCEVDVRRSRDGVAVLSHDPEVEGRMVHETDWRHLEEGGLCRLEDVLTLDGAIDFEVKNSGGEAGYDPSGALARQVAESARPRDVLSSFNWADMDLVRRSHPQVRTGLLVAPSQDPHPPMVWAAEGGHAFLAPHHSLITAHLCEQARSLGVKVVAWTVNDPVRAEELSAMGVAAIITDRPGSIRPREEAG